MGHLSMGVDVHSNIHGNIHGDIHGNGCKELCHENLKKCPPLELSPKIGTIQTQANPHHPTVCVDTAQKTLYPTQARGAWELGYLDGVQCSPRWGYLWGFFYACI
jgi:hypothetical protein